MSLTVDIPSDLFNKVLDDAEERGYYPKRYNGLPKDYQSPKDVAVAFEFASAAIMDAFEKNKLDMSESSVHISNFAKFVEFKAPLFWVGKELSDVCDQTGFSEDLTPDDLNWPMESMCFLLPKGALSDEDGDPVTVLMLSIKKVAEQSSLPGVKPALTSENRNGHEMCMVSGFGPAGTSHTFWGSTPMDKPLNYLDSDEVSHRGTVTESKFVRKLLAYGLQLLTIMSARPEYVEHVLAGKKAKSKKKGKSKPVTYFYPRWVGRNYTYKRSKSKEHQGGTVATHWRRGYTRKQSFGPGRTESKVIWIEPTLVNP